QGQVTYHNDSSKIINENVFNLSDKLKQSSEKALDGNFNEVQYDYDGVKQVAIYNYIPSLNWGIMVTVPKSEVHAAFVRISIITAILIVILIGIIAVLGMYISNNLTRPIGKLAVLSKEVAEGDLSNECNLNGSLEMNNIGKDFNEMILSLKNLVLSIRSNSDELMSASITLNAMSETAKITSKDISQEQWKKYQVFQFNKLKRLKMC
ncbi:MAG: methyl-accepting chemotaxis protein, partial [Clostridium sp.]|nr:methyl-accepting chemotaxis protein [Clostridium sp.]